MGKFDNFDGLPLKDKAKRTKVDISKNNKKVKMTLYGNERTTEKIQKIFEELNTKTKNDIYDIVIDDYAKGQGINLTEDAVYIDMDDAPKVYSSFSLIINKKEKLDEITKYMGIQNRSLTIEWIIENYRKDYDQ